MHQQPSHARAVKHPQTHRVAILKVGPGNQQLPDHHIPDYKRNISGGNAWVLNAVELCAACTLQGQRTAGDTKLMRPIQELHVELQLYSEICSGT